MIRPYPYRQESRDSRERNFRGCDAPDCAGHGQHRAPKSRLDLYDYYWFCLDHVREYNKAWNYCSGMTMNELDHMIRSAMVGERPSWPMGYWRVREKQVRENLYEEFLREGRARARRQKEIDADTPRAQALKVLELDAGADFTAIRQRYLLLVKKHHPDGDLKDASRTETIKRINQAYAVLKALHSATA